MIIAGLHGPPRGLGPRKLYFPSPLVDGLEIQKRKMSSDSYCTTVDNCHMKFVVRI